MQPCLVAHLFSLIIFVLLHLIIFVLLEFYTKQLLPNSMTLQYGSGIRLH